MASVDVSTKNITLCWMLVYFGIHGNEMVDLKAKAADSSSCDTHVPLPHTLNWGK